MKNERDGFSFPRRILFIRTIFWCWIEIWECNLFSIFHKVVIAFCCTLHYAYFSKIISFYTYHKGCTDTYIDFSVFIMIIEHYLFFFKIIQLIHISFCIFELQTIELNPEKLFAKKYFSFFNVDYSTKITLSFSCSFTSKHRCGMSSSMGSSMGWQWPSSARNRTVPGICTCLGNKTCREISREG